MQRKLVKQGRGALTVTLPSKWLLERKLIAGSTVEISEGNDNLVITSKQKRQFRKISLDLRHYTKRGMIFHILQSKYIEGYDQIEVFHKKPNLMDQVLTMLIGFTISEHGKNRTVFRSIVAVPEDNFNVILRRVAHQLVQQANDLQLIVSKEISLQEYHRRETIFDAHLLYCLRYLHKYVSSEAYYKQFLLCATFELVADQLRRIAKSIETVKIKKDFAEEISTLIENYVGALFAKDFVTIYSMLRKKLENSNKVTYLDGLVHCLYEIIYNNLGYLVEEK